MWKSAESEVPTTYLSAKFVKNCTPFFPSVGVCSWIAGQDPWHAEAQYSSEEMKLLPPPPFVIQSHPSFSNFRGVTFHPWAGAHPIPLPLLHPMGRRWRQNYWRFNQILISRAYFSHFVGFICIILFYFTFFCNGGKMSLFWNVFKCISC